MAFLYYLVYKIPNNKNMWIVCVHEYSNDLLDYLNKIVSKDEIYYLYEEEVYKNIDKELKNKHFRLFQKSEYSNLLAKTNS